MAILSRTFLTDLGIELNEADYQALSDHFDTTLHQRVVDEIIDELMPEQADELAALQGHDDTEIQAWLTANVPDLAEIVSDEVYILLGEIAEHSDAI